MHTSDPTILSEKTDSYLTQLIQKWGNEVSLTLYDKSCLFFYSDKTEGVIGYRQHKNVVVVIGEPLAQKEDKWLLTEEFRHHCQKKGLSLLFLTVSKEFSAQICQTWNGSSLEIGTHLICDLNKDPQKGSLGRVIRRKTNHAKKLGVCIYEYQSDQPSSKKELEKLTTEWLKKRKGPQIYLADVDCFKGQKGKKWFYATHEGRIVGAIILHNLEQLSGYLVHIVMTSSSAPNGTGELLILKAMQALKQEGFKFISFGVAQIDEIGEMNGFSPFYKWIAKIGFKIAKKMFSLDGRRKFWEKFQPIQSPSYIVFDKKNITLKQLAALIKSLNISLS
ncbi:MAG: phosphatidylglycerol lysyltransferase domain-containing protein [Rhabdochlamydiaceae bacterium]